MNDNLKNAYNWKVSPTLKQFDNLLESFKVLQPNAYDFKPA